MRYILFITCLIASCFTLLAQTTFCPDDPPQNPYLADSPWPTYHRNNYAQSSTCIAGPMPGDSILIKKRSNIQGGTSPWTYFTEPYSNGQRAILQSNTTHVFKFLDNGSEIIAVDSLRIDFDPVTSFGWNFLLSKNKIWFTYDPKYDPEEGQSSRIFKLTDEDTSDIYAPIVVLDTFDFGDIGLNKVQHYQITYDGNILFGSENDEENGYATIGILTKDFELLDTLRYLTLPGEITHHNAFTLEETNHIYLVTTERMICFFWDGQVLSKEWESYYDFVNDGPTGAFAEGSGTTPTLLGWGSGNDRLVVLADGHENNNLVAFWREIPEGWQGIPGYDIRLAGIISLPLASSFSNIFQSIENSPTARGYEIAIAQFNGFLGYDCDNIKGVQKIKWDTLNNVFELAWMNDEINMNGVLTYSSGSNLLYGSGKEEDCNYYYYALDWDSGALAMRILMGPEGTFLDDPYYDAGNNSIISEEGHIYFAGGASLVKVEIAKRATSAATGVYTESGQLSVFPNPARHTIRLNRQIAQTTTGFIYDNMGKLVHTFSSTSQELNISHLNAGLYFLRADGQVCKFLVQ
jgi:hypothetical protein